MSTRTVITATDMVLQNAEFQIAELSIICAIKKDSANKRNAEDVILDQNKKSEVSISDLSAYLSHSRKLRQDLSSLEFLYNCHSEFFHGSKKSFKFLEKIAYSICNISDVDIIKAMDRQIGTLENLSKEATNIRTFRNIQSTKNKAVIFFEDIRNHNYGKSVFLYA